MFKVKYLFTRAIVKFKLQLIAQDFYQIIDSNYKKKFAFIIKRELLCIFLAISIALGLIIYLIDIISAYYNDVPCLIPWTALSHQLLDPYI